MQQHESGASANPSSEVTRTLKLKVRPESYAWLNHAAAEVNQVFNWANETSYRAACPFAGKSKWLSGFDLNNLSAGATEEFNRIGADTIQRVNQEFALKRRQFKKTKLRWRTSHGARKSLGWIPFKASSIRRSGNALRFAGKTFRLFDREYLGNVVFKDGCFAQDSVGDWYFCMPAQVSINKSVAVKEIVGIDLGLKTIATTSDGEKLEAGKWTQLYADKLANAQRRAHKKQAKRIHRKIARCRKDALHKFSTKIVAQYQHIRIGDVSSSKLVKTKMAKSVLDSGWGMLRKFLEYKSQQAARDFQIVDEKNTSRTCSSCGSLSGPRGVNGLRVRSWICGDCGESHDRDVNAARLIRLRGEMPPSMSGNKLSLNEVAA